MRSRLHKFVLTWCLIAAIGGHWPLLQSVAWMKMFAEFVQEDSLAVAISKTFDGKHPCRLCLLVKEGKDKEKRPLAIKADFKIDLFLVQIESLILATAPGHRTDYRSPAWVFNSLVPLLPPPKFA